jgi:hypothetical protein
VRATATPPGPTGSVRPILIAGLPRSGSTWTMEVVECDPSLRSIMEPDSERHKASAIWAKRRTGRFPVLVPGDRSDHYRQLWSWVFAGAPEGPRLRLADKVLRGVGPPEENSFLRGQGSLKMTVAGLLGRHPRWSPTGHGDGRRPLVKTVHAPLSIDWLATEFDIEVVVVLRHPGSVLASWLALDFVDQYVAFEERPGVQQLAAKWAVPLPGPEQLERTIWRIGLLTTALEQAVASHPTWVVRTHEELCVHPVAAFQRLFADLGLTWNDRAEAHLTANDRVGKGFRTQRLASELPDNWKRRLTVDQIRKMTEVLGRFPLERWGDEDFTADAVE